MTDFRQHYKKKTLGFGNADESRILRAERQAEGRKVRRAENFAKTRDYTKIESSSKFDCKDNAQDSSERVENAQMDRRTKLMKWKEERDMRKRLQQRLKKPVFRVGIVHHNISSPVFKDVSNFSQQDHSKLYKLIKKQPTPPRRTTRATEKRLAAKLAASSQSKSNVTSVKQTLRSKNEASRVETLKDANVPSAKKNISKQSFAPENYKFKGPSGLPTLPMFGQAALQHAQVNLNTEKITLHITNEEKDTIASRDRPLRSASSTTKSFTNKVLSPREVPPYEKKNEEEHRDLSMTDNESNCMEEKEVERKADVETSTKPCVEDVSSASNSSIEAITLRLSSDEQDNLDSVDKENVFNTDTLSDDNCKSTVPAREDTPSAPVYFSPYIVSSRGKSSARKEQQVRLGIGHSPSNEVPTKDTIMKNLNICVEEEERTSQYFKYLLNQEIERLTDLCGKWTEIMSAPEITEDAQYQINQAIGQTNLLMRNKLKRFRELVLDCETGKGQQLVTCRDLQGFWDLAYMDIKDCEFRFGKLEELKSKDWVEEQPIVVKQVVKRKAPVKKQAVSRKQSSIRAMILAEKKKKREREEGKADTDEIVIKGKKQAAPSSQLSVVEFDGGFFMVSSPKRSINKKSEECNSSVSRSEKKKRSSLLHKTQLFEASKNMNSPLTVIKISQMCKTPEVRLDNSIAYINSDQIPGKSILKRTEDDTVIESRSVKSLHKVNFNNDVTLNEIPIDKELQNKLDLAAALDKIDNCDLEENTLKIHAEKKLNFDDDSFEATESVMQEEIEKHDDSFDKEYKGSGQSLDGEERSLAIPALSIIASTPIPEKHSSDTAHIVRSKSKKTLRRQKHVIDEEEINRSTETSRILRSQTVSKKDVSNNSRKSFKEEDEKEEDRNKDQKENKNPTKARRSLKTIVKENSSPEKEEPKTPRGRRKSAKARSSNVAEQSDQDFSRRRSTRKSVRFTGEDCLICMENKPVQPMTPHVRRKRSTQSRISLLGENTTESVAPLSSGDLISWDSPAQTPMRVRRSHRIAHSSNKQ